jgi:8-oxo-dGTP pyrophosphatase MutT (NUDIX family)
MRNPRNLPETVSAGGVVTKIEDGKIFVGLLREGNFKEWLLPKGHVKRGETLENAARREIEEELGLTKVEMVCKLGVIERESFERDEWKIIHFFLFVQRDLEEFLPKDQEKIYHPRWHFLDDLPKMFLGGQEKLLKESIGKIKKILLEV